MPTTWFTADHHFGHRNVIRFCNRPFATVEEMDRAMVDNWNAVVRPDDVVWHLGDFAYRCDADHLARIFKRLHGHKHLIIGNHDNDAVKKLGWKVVDKYIMIRVEDQRLFLNHYSQQSWPGQHHGVQHLFGHSHGTLPGLGRSLDVGVDPWNFFPIQLSDFKPRLDAIPLPSFDDDEDEEPSLPSS